LEDESEAAGAVLVHFDFVLEDFFFGWGFATLDSSEEAFKATGAVLVVFFFSGGSGDFIAFSSEVFFVCVWVLVALLSSQKKQESHFCELEP
jgi:hypothetical protein